MMPRKRRTPHQRREGYGDGHRFHLKLGHAYEFLGPTFGRDEAFDREAAREAWAILRPEIMAEFITERPCQRPAAWWWFEAPELRRRVDGGLHPCEDPERETEPYRGMPGSYSTEDDFRAEYESEAAYLLRLGQLLRAERDYLTDHPELLKPESHVYLLRTAILPES